MHQVNRSRIPLVITGIVAIAALLGLVTLSWEIYGIAGWRDEVYYLQGGNGSSRAMDDFRKGYLRMYRLGAEQDRARSTGETNGVFEIWTQQYYPSLGAAHRYSTEQFIAFYNRKMAYMHTHPERFRRGTTRSNQSLDPTALSLRVVHTTTVPASQVSSALALGRRAIDQWGRSASSYDI